MAILPWVGSTTQWVDPAHSHLEAAERLHCLCHRHWTCAPSALRSFSLLRPWPPPPPPSQPPSAPCSSTRRLVAPPSCFPASGSRACSATASASASSRPRVGAPSYSRPSPPPQPARNSLPTETISPATRARSTSMRKRAPRAYSPPRSRPTRGDEPGRLFVGNLPYTYTSEELAQVFAEAGRVDDAQIIYDKVTNRSRGFAFVTMATAEESAKAIQMFDGALLGGRTARVNYPEVPRGGERRTVTMGGRRRDDGTYKIYAGNLGWGVRADTLRNVFEGKAGLLDARVIFERDTGRSRGFGFVSFRTAEDAQAALEALDGVELEGRPLRLSLAEQNPPPGTPPSTAQAQLEETDSGVSDAETEADSSSELSEAELDESNLQTAATYQ